MVNPFLNMLDTQHSLSLTPSHAAVRMLSDTLFESPLSMHSDTDVNTPTRNDMNDDLFDLTQDK